MSGVGRVFRAIFNRRLAWAAFIIAAAVTVNLIGIYVIGNVNDWSQWLKNHRGYFLTWRLCLYGATAYGWWKMRRKILTRESGPETAIRLSRTEIAALLTVIGLEAAVFVQSG